MSKQISPRSQTRVLALSERVEALAVYGAFALIGAVVFGTFSLHSF